MSGLETRARQEPEPEVNPKPVALSLRFSLPAALKTGFYLPLSCLSTLKSPLDLEQPLNHLFQWLSLY